MLARFFTVLLYGILLGLTFFQCRRTISFDEIVRSPDAPLEDRSSLIKDIQLIDTTRTGPKAAVLTENNEIIFDACAPRCVLLKIELDAQAASVPWNSIFNNDAEKSFIVTRKVNTIPDSSNYFQLCTRGFIPDTAMATLAITTPSPLGGQNTLLSLTLSQTGAPVNQLKISAKKKGNTPVPTCQENDNTNVSVENILKSGSCPSVYIKDKRTNPAVKVDSLVIGCKGTMTDPVYLCIDANSTLCNCRGAATPQSNCLSNYADDAILWVASAHSQKDWLKISPHTSQPTNTNTSTNANARTSVRGTKKTKYLSLHILENTSNEDKNDGIIEFYRNASGKELPFRIKIFQQKKTTTTSSSSTAVTCPVTSP